MPALETRFARYFEPQPGSLGPSSTQLRLLGKMSQFTLTFWEKSYRSATQVCRAVNAAAVLSAHSFALQSDMADHMANGEPTGGILKEHRLASDWILHRTTGAAQAGGRTTGLAAAGSRGMWLHPTSLQEREKTDMPLSCSGLFGERAIAALEESSWTGTPVSQTTRATWSPRLRLQLSRQQTSSPVQ